MRNINRAIIAGNLVRDAELRHAQSGLAVMTFGVAVNESRKNPSTGEWEDYANFIDCTMMGDRAEKLSEHLVKGTRVAVDGRLRQSRWEKDGQKRSKVEVMVEQVEFLSRRDEVQQEPDIGLYDDDVPF